MIEGRTLTLNTHETVFVVFRQLPPSPEHCHSVETAHQTTRSVAAASSGPVHRRQGGNARVVERHAMRASGISGTGTYSTTMSAPKVGFHHGAAVA
jgi:hypothetical protein